MMIPQRKWQIMYKNIIYVSLSDPEFQRVFAETLASVSRNLDVRTIAGAEELPESSRLKVCICDEVTEKNFTASGALDNSCIMVRLTYDPDSAEDGDGKNVMYAYEGARETAGRIFSLISERSGEDVSFSSGEDRPVVVSVISSGGGTGATAVGAGIAAMIPVMYGEKALYVSYGSFPGNTAFVLMGREEGRNGPGDMEEGSLSRILYHIHRGKSFDIDSFIWESRGWGILKTGRFNPGYRMLTLEGAEKIGAAAAGDWGAGYLLIDIGNRIDENSLKIVNMSDVIVDVASGDGLFASKIMPEDLAAPEAEGGRNRRLIRVRNRWRGDWGSEDDRTVYISEVKELTEGSLDTRFGTEIGPAVREIVEGK